MFSDGHQRGFRGVPGLEAVLGGCQKVIMGEVGVELLMDYIPRPPGGGGGSDPTPPPSVFLE